MNSAVQLGGSRCIPLAPGHAGASGNVLVGGRAGNHQIEHAQTIRRWMNLRAFPLGGWWLVLVPRGRRRLPPVLIRAVRCFQC